MFPYPCLTQDCFMITKPCLTYSSLLSSKVKILSGHDPRVGKITAVPVQGATSCSFFCCSCRVMVPYLYMWRNQQPTCTKISRHHHWVKMIVRVRSSRLLVGLLRGRLPIVLVDLLQVLTLLLPIKSRYRMHRQTYRPNQVALKVRCECARSH